MPTTSRGRSARGAWSRRSRGTRGTARPACSSRCGRRTGPRRAARPARRSPRARSRRWPAPAGRRSCTHHLHRLAAEEAGEHRARRCPWAAAQTPSTRRSGRSRSPPRPPAAGPSRASRRRRPCGSASAARPCRSNSARGTCPVARSRPRVLREDGGQRDVRAAVLGPARQDRQLVQVASGRHDLLARRRCARTSAASRPATSACPSARSCRACPPAAQLEHVCDPLGDVVDPLDAERHARRRSEPNWLVSTGMDEPATFGTAARGRAPLMTRSAISVISRSGSTSAVTSCSSPRRRRRSSQSRRSREGHRGASVAVGRACRYIGACCPQRCPPCCSSPSPCTPDGVRGSRTPATAAYFDDPIGGWAVMNGYEICGRAVIGTTELSGGMTRWSGSPYASAGRASGRRDVPAAD